MFTHLPPLPPLYVVSAHVHTCAGRQYIAEDSCNIKQYLTKRLGKNADFIAISPRRYFSQSILFSLVLPGDPSVCGKKFSMLKKLLGKDRPFLDENIKVLDYTLQHSHPLTCAVCVCQISVVVFHYDSDCFNLLPLMSDFSGLRVISLFSVNRLFTKSLCMDLN